jgi:oxygen-independent coproporphyrinogen-3 oxidase
MVGLGVASFGYVNGVHMQNLDKDTEYMASIEAGVLPLARALRPSDEERFIREFVLQLKLGSIRPSYFDRKYGVNVVQRYQDQLGRLAADRMLTQEADRVALTREGLLRVDSFLPRFFKPEHAAVRYT